MKKLTKVLAVLALLTGFIGVASTQKDTVQVEAATANTKRVWMKNSITSTWDADGAGTAIHYWGGSQGTDWPGVRGSWDPANELVYFDIPADITTYMFVRVSGEDPISDWGAKTKNLEYDDSVGKYFNLTGPIAWNGALTPGSFVAFTPATTTIVANFAATIDTSGEACNAAAAQTAVDAYNNLSTFERNQFDVMAVGDVGDGMTGLDRLTYLKSFYNISTSLNVNRVTIPRESNSNVIAILSIGGISLTSIIGYYFLKSKKYI